MMFESLIKLRLFVFCTMLTACQENLHLMKQEADLSAEGEGSQTAKALCNVWLKVLPTWTDEDTERTKDEVDYITRVQEKVCKTF